MNETLQEKIVMTVDTSGIKANSLAGLLSELRAIDGAVTQLYTKLGSGPKINANFIQPLNLIKDTLDKNFKQKGPYAATDIFKSLGLDESSLNQALARLTLLGSKLKDFQTRSGTFGSLDAAARGASQVFKAELESLDKTLKAHQSAIGRALGGQGGGITAAGKDVALKVEGMLSVTIPGSQIQATVVGPIPLIVQGSQLAGGGGGASGGGGGRDPNTGQFVAGGGGKRKKAKGTKQPLDLDEAEGETGRVRTETPESTREAITRIGETGDVITEIHDSVEGVIRTITRSTTGSSPLQRWRAAKKQLDEEFKQAQAGVAPGDLGTGLASAQANYAKGLASLISKDAGGDYTNSLLQGMPRPQADLIAGVLAQSAATMSARSAGTQASAEAAAVEMARKERARFVGQVINANLVDPYRGVGKSARSSAEVFEQLYGGTPPPPFDPGFARERAGGARHGVPGAYPYGWPARWQRRRRGAGAPIDAEFSPDDSVIDVESTPVKPKQSRFSKALGDSFSPEGFATHFVKVAGWAAAVESLYKPLQLAEYSLERFLDLGQQTARLSTVFRGVGGNVQQLTDDVLKLAAANGRSTDEAMESAEEWARLGLTRVQINEAVRVSLEAANIAQISAGDATKQMAALMHVYGMSVGQLDTALGVLVNTSQKFNVTTADLLGGLDRSAAAAKLAGVSFAELQGLIGATSGGIGQSGIQIGNTLKNLFTQFTRPEMMSYLQSQGIGTTNVNGGFANGSEVLRQMFIKYQSMDPTQQRNLGTVVAGRLQTARFAGLMNEYPEAQKLAIDGQLRMNAALETNAIIIETVRSQLKGLGAEWDRLLVNSGSQSMATGILRTGKNVLHAAANFMGGDLSGDTSSARSMSDADLAAAVAEHFPGVRRGLENNTGSAQMDAVFQESARRQAIRDRKNGVGLWRGLIHRPFGVGLGNYFNAYEESDANATMPIDQFNRNYGAGQGRMEAFERMARLFETAQSLGGVRSAGSDKTREIAGGYERDLGLAGGTDYTTAAAAARQKEADEMVAQMQALASRKAELDSAHSSGKLDDTEYRDQLDNIVKLTQATEQASDEEISSITDQINRRQEYVNLLKEQTSVMELVNKLSSQVQTGTLGSQSDAQLNAVKENIVSLEAQKAALVGSNSSVPVADLAAWQQITQQLRDAQAQRATLESPRYQAAVTAYDSRSIAINRASQDAAASGVGYTEAEKLLNRQRALQTEAAALDAKRAGGSATDNEIVRGMQLEVDLAKTHADIQARIVELKGQEKQILIDSTREYQKAMLLSGPGELLKRLYVGARGANGGFDTGSFMSLDPESRKYFYASRGGEAGAKNREEQALLGGQALTVEGQQAQAQRDRAGLKRFGDALPNPIAGLPGLPAPKEDPLVTQAMKSATALAGFTAKLMTAANALDVFQATLAAMGVKPGAAAAKGPSLDLSPGHALGSTLQTPMMHMTGGVLG